MSEILSVGLEGTSSAPVESSFEDPTVGRLHTIFQKLKTGGDLSRAEVEFLGESAAITDGYGARLLSTVWTPADESSVQRIQSLSQRVLGEHGGISGRELIDNIENFFAGRRTITTRELSSMARLLKNSFAQDPIFAAVVNRLSIKEGRPPYRDELIKLVADHNKTAIPKPARAGQLAASVPISAEGIDLPRSLEVRYNAQGLLEIFDGEVAPMDISCSQTLTKPQVKEMETLYQAINDKTHFNNFAMVLEFARFFREAQSKKSDITLREAFDQFRPNLVSLFEKYQSGNCAVLAAKFCHEMEQQLGIHGQPLAKPTENAWTGVPIPGTEDSQVKWLEFTQVVRGADHTNVGVPYRDEQGRECYTQFACSFEPNKPDEIERHLPTSQRSGLDHFFMMSGGYSRTYLPDQVLDSSTLAKNGLLARFKAAMSRDGKTMGVDFLRGNFYLNPSWTKTLKGFPLNEKGMASIDLVALATPDAKGTYFIDGKPVNMTHREVLQIMLKEASTVFAIPPDMEENIITMAQMAPLMSDQLYLQPLPFIQEHYADLQAIGRKYNAMKPTMNRELSSEQMDAFEQVRDAHDALIDALVLDYNPGKALEAIQVLKKLLNI
ncbi:MAG: hypothetical protein KDK64_00710 [Chlamydiia bacterium]|nr:hypothetical protein [Chlamydiia bacterium]